MIGEKSGSCPPSSPLPISSFFSNQFVCETKRNSIPAQRTTVQGVASPLIHPSSASECFLAIEAQRSTPGHTAFFAALCRPRPANPCQFAQFRPPVTTPWRSPALFLSFFL